MKTLLCAFIACGAAIIPAWAVDADHIEMSELTPVSATQDYGSLELDRSVQGQALQIGSTGYAYGLGTHANSRVVYDLGGHFTRFESWVGVDAEMSGYKQSSVVFQIFGDGKKLFDSGIMRIDTPAKQAAADMHGVRELALVVTDAGDGIECDHADWADATLFADPAQIRGLTQPIADQTPKYEVRGGSLAVKLSADGDIVGASLGKSVKVITAQTRLGGCRQVGQVKADKHLSGAVVFARRMRQIVSGNMCTLTEKFIPTLNSVRWEIEIKSDAKPWTTGITTELNYPATEATRFWTGWSDPDHRSDGWRDPLVLRPFETVSWSYGGGCSSGGFTVLPLATIAEPVDDSGLSLVFSPEDTYLDSSLRTSSSGTIRFSRTMHRLGGGKTLHFAMDLTSHEADWRGGLRWMVQRYREFFDPPNPTADTMAGCGAYSGNENPIDAAKFQRMGFRVNWKLSDDFPYMGMFIPPVKNADEEWERSCDEPEPPGKTRMENARRMNEYARWMRTNGFFVLNYFNVTEFGKKMGNPPKAKPGDPDLWKDPRAFLKYDLPGAVLIPGNATCYEASVVDPGDPGFQKFLLEQAARHNQVIPDSSGICIDRTDWLSRYNPGADDGVSWVNGKPARSLYVSWQSLLSKLGPLMHADGKVIFINSLTSRLDLMRQIDGIYCEFGNTGPALNSSALMAIRKPALEWTYLETLRPDPDLFFQKHLHLGAYPTAPYPNNNHCIGPDAGAEKFYLDYGPLLDAMRGKKWVLTPHCVVTTTPGVKVNLFEVPGGYALPVTFGGTAGFADVVVRNVVNAETLHAEALHPGEEKSAPVDSSLKNGALSLHVPLQRGCAMVVLRSSFQHR